MYIVAQYVKNTDSIASLKLTLQVRQTEFDISKCLTNSILPNKRRLLEVQLHN